MRSSRTTSRRPPTSTNVKPAVLNASASAGSSSALNAFARKIPFIVVFGGSVPIDVDVIQIGGDFEVCWPAVPLHGLPFGRRTNQLPCRWIADAHRHHECLLARLPAVADGSRRGVEFQFQHRHLCVPKVLVEDWRQVHACLL